MCILTKLGVTVVLSFCGSLAGAGVPDALPTFNRNIRPILSDNCYACHGPDKNTRKAKLRLDSADEAYAEKEGKFPLVPGKPEVSEVIRRITSTDPEEVMPPPKTGKKLTGQQIATIRQWIEAGAKYEQHWAYILPKRPAIPKVRNTSWPLNPIDYFILARLESEKLDPSPEAEKQTLARRLSFDLNGLPPTPEQVETFGRTKDSDAYGKLVSGLLNSSHFGERMAVHWLDLVRYADTVGYHGDTPVSVWPYRDYVIKAFNQNLRYDQFTREQLAGDLMPNSSVVQKVASGFNRLNRMSTEGGIQDKEYLAKYAADRVRTISAIWMGSTMGCSECHDHKFDPFSTKDFYQMEAFFADLKEKGYYPDGFGKGDWGPRISVPEPAQAKQLKLLEERIAALTNKIAAIPTEELKAGQAAWESRIDWLAKGDRLRWKEVAPLQAVSSGGSTLTIQTNASVLASGKVPEHDDYTVTIPAILPRITAIRLEVMRDESLAGNEIARAGETFVLGEVEVAVRAKSSPEPKRIKIRSTTASFSYDGFPIAAAIDGNLNTGWAQGPRPTRDRVASFVLDRPVRGGPDVAMIITLRQSRKFPRQQLGKFRLSLTEVESAHYDKATVPTNVLAALKIPVDERKTNQQQVISTFYRTIAAQTQRMNVELARLERDRMLLLGDIPTTLVSESTNARPIRILPRGNWMTDSGALVTPGTPHFLPAINSGTNQPTRLDLANWFVSTNNPLTARVFVNRLWKIYFGTGLSRTLDDFGIQGEWPTHPELLDWLATEFMERGWDVKHMVTLMVSSRTYRQSSQATSILDERDPLNRLLARQSRFRLDAEFVRDNALAISGLLVDKQGGPSVHPYQPDGYYLPLNFPHREYVPDEGAGQYRRGVYTHWQRTFLHPSLLAFDASPREECTVNRVNSNTPLQALALLNDPSYVEAARVFAGNILRKGGSTFESRVGWAYRKALCREPRASEISLLRELYDKQLANYRTHESAARELLGVGYTPLSERHELPELAAWASVARALLNLNETITRS